MGNKDIGRAYAKMDNIEYTKAMGGTIDGITINHRRNATGTSWTTRDVYKYFKLLSNYAMCRCKWTSPQIPEYELRLIEYYLFYYGRCAMLYPLVRLSPYQCYKIDKLKIFQCTPENINARNKRPRSITIVNNSKSRFVLETRYFADEYVIFTDEFLQSPDTNPFFYVTQEFANKLHEVDLAFKMNTNQLRMPFVFNGVKLEKDDIEKDIRGVATGNSLAEIMRSAFGRNEAFVNIPQNLVGSDKFMHEPQYVTNRLLEYIEVQKKLIQQFLEFLGLFTAKDKTGVYTVKRLQEEGDESPSYITDVWKNNRLICAREAVNKFNIDLTLEII